MQMKDKRVVFHGGNDGGGGSGGGGSSNDNAVSMRDSCVCVLDCCLFRVGVRVEGHVGGDGAWVVFGMKNLCIFRLQARSLP